MFSFAAYIPAEAEVFPVDAQTIFFAPTSFACVTAADIPLSLKEPLGLYPSGCNDRFSFFNPTKFATLDMWYGFDCRPSAPSSETKCLEHSSIFPVSI